MRVRSFTTLLAVSLLAGCGTDPGDARAPSRATGPGHGSNEEWFTDRASDAGLDFVHFNGISGAFYFPEALPAGVGLLDYDNDGDLDVYLVQGQMLGAGKTLRDRKSTRLNSSHVRISYAVFCL